MKSLFRTLCVLTTLAGASQYAVAAPVESVACKLEKGAAATRPY
jgi:hypothetical protein